MHSVAHLTFEAGSKTSIDPLEFLLTSVLALVGVSELILNLLDPSLSFHWLQVGVAFTIDNLMYATFQIFFQPERALASPGFGPLSPAQVAELCTTAAPFKDGQSRTTQRLQRTYVT